MKDPPDKPRRLRARIFCLGLAFLTHLLAIVALKFDSVRDVSVGTAVTLAVLLLIVVWRESTVAYESTRRGKRLAFLLWAACAAFAGIAAWRLSTWASTMAIGCSLLAAKMWLTGGSTRQALPLVILLALLIRLPTARDEAILARYVELVGIQWDSVLDWMHVPHLVKGQTIRTIETDWDFLNHRIPASSAMIILGSLIYVAWIARSWLAAISLLGVAIFWGVAADIFGPVSTIVYAHLGAGYEPNELVEVMVAILAVIGLLLVHLSNQLGRIVFAPLQELTAVKWGRKRRKTPWWRRVKPRQLIGSIKPGMAYSAPKRRRKK